MMKTNHPQIHTTFAFVVDGKTERWYLDMMKRNERALHIAIKPELAIKKTVDEQFKQVCKLSKDYYKVFWIVDIDTYIKEYRENPKTTKITQLEKAIKKLPSNAFFIANTPCLEYWILLHIKKTSRYYSNCDAVMAEIRKYSPLEKYEKTEKYYTQTNDIYARLKPYLTNARENAQKLPSFDIQKMEQGVCEMFKIFDKLGIEK